MTDNPFPHNLEAARREVAVEEAKRSRREWAVMTLVVAVLAGVIALNVFRFTDEAKQSTSQRLLRQTLVDSERRDCVTNIQAARRAVFDDVDLYKAVLIKAAADNAVYGGITPAQTSEFRAADVKLGAALTEARRLRPSRVLVGLIAHGGLIDGVKYSGCPG